MVCFVGWISALLLICGVIISSKGLPERLGAFEAAYLNAKNPKRGSLSGCQSVGCVEPGALIFWGDSHANALMNSALTGRQIIDLTKSGCPPLVGSSIHDFSFLAMDCIKHNDAAWQLVTAVDNANLVLHARWPLNIVGTRWGSEWGGDRLVSIGSSADGRANFLSGQLARLVPQSSQALNVIVVGSVPEQKVNIPEYFGSVILRASNSVSTNARCPVLGVDLPAWKAERDMQFALPDKVHYVSPTELLCNENQCPGISALPCEPRYADNNHLATNYYRWVWVAVNKLL